MHSKKANSRAAQNSKKQAVATGGATICCLLQTTWRRKKATAAKGGFKYLTLTSNKTEESTVTLDPKRWCRRVRHRRGRRHHSVQPAQGSSSEPPGAP